MSREIIYTPAAPTPPPMYSQAVKAAGLIFVSGTGPYDPRSGAVTGTTIQVPDARNVERLETMTRRDGLVALVVRINPDAKIMSAEPLHPAFTTFVSSAAFIRWKPTAYDEKCIAGRFWTDGTQSEFRQRWSYDVTFSTPITLDPAAKTLRKN